MSLLDNRKTLEWALQCDLKRIQQSRAYQLCNEATQVKVGDKTFTLPGKMNLNEVIQLLPSEIRRAASAEGVIKLTHRPVSLA